MRTEVTILVPRGRESEVVRYRDGVMTPLAELSVPWRAPLAIGDCGWLAYITAGGHQLARGMLHDDGSLAPLPPVPLHGHDVVVHGDHAIVGGSFRGRPALFSVTLDEEPPMIVPYPAPRARHHSYDVLLHFDDALFAMDDGAPPTLITRYDIRDPMAPTITAMEQHDIPLPSEQRRTACIGPRFIAVLSSALDEERLPVDVIRLVDSTTLRLVGHFGYRTGPSGETVDGSPSIPTERITGISFLDDRLLIAAGRAGLAVADLSQVDMTDSPRSTPRWSWRVACRRNMLRLRYPNRAEHRLPLSYEVQLWWNTFGASHVEDVIGVHGSDEALIVYSDHVLTRWRSTSLRTMGSAFD